MQVNPPTALHAPDALPPRLAAIHRELGIPAAYAAERQLTLQTEANEAELVDVGPNPDGRTVLLTPAAALAWHAMRQAARHEHLDLIPISGFRSVARQTEIIQGKLAAGQPIEPILRLVAAPGFSEHHTGCALDIGTPGHIDLEENFALTPAYRWLEGRAETFGFRLSFPRGNQHRISFEPWHWFFR